MKKKVRLFPIKYKIDWYWDTEITKIKKDIEELEKLGATHIYFNARYEDEIPLIEIEPYSKRVETDEEFKERLYIQQKRDDAKKEWELKQLELLKSKYDK